MSKEFFVRSYLSPLLEAAKGMWCWYATGNEIDRTLDGLALIHIDEHSEYVVIKCENGYHYVVDVSADSLCTLAAEVLRFASYK